MVVGRFYRIDNVRLKADRNRHGYEGSLGGQEKRITPVLMDAPTLYLEKLLERRDGRRPQPSWTQSPSPENEEIPTLPLRLNPPTQLPLRIQSKPSTATVPNPATNTDSNLPRAHLRIVSNLVGAPRLVTPISSIFKHGKCPASFHIHGKINQYETDILEDTMCPFCEGCNKWYALSDPPVPLPALTRPSGSSDMTSTAACAAGMLPKRSNCIWS
jgi:hypothetical protein